MEFDEIIKNVIEVCKKNKVSELYLFGSYAKGNNHQGSDIDIVVGGDYNYYDLEDELDNIMTLKKIDIFEKKMLKYNKYLQEDFDKYARKIY